MVHNNNIKRSRSLKRRSNDLLTTVTHVLTDEDELDDDHVEQQCYEQQQTPLSNHNSRLVRCDLEFEYYNKKDEDEFYDHQEQSQRRWYSSTTASKHNARCGEQLVQEKEDGDRRFSSQNIMNTSACTVMRASSSFLRLQNDHRFADVA